MFSLGCHCFTEKFCMKDSKWFSPLPSLQIFEFSKIRRPCFLNKLTCLRRHNFKTYEMQVRKWFLLT